MIETHSAPHCLESTSVGEANCDTSNAIISNPYASVKDYCYWSRGVMRVAPGLLDPVTKSAIIDKNAKISTIGSCFAQHVSRHLADVGCNFFVAEKAPSNYTAKEKMIYNYDIYSARYGNIYTARQALQLFDRAYGYFTPRDDVWNKADKYVDAFRPTIDPVGWSSVEEVRNETKHHLKYVRDVFEQSDWIFFTLGLTESWLSIADGAVYPVAPGVAGGNFDPQKYVFHNFTYPEVVADLSLFIDKLRSINPTIQIILTVSPVPLVATYEDRHVLVSTIHSKSVLCAAAHEMESKYHSITYFPAYDIITSPIVQGNYFNDDLRTVNSVGVSHVMRLFKEHFLNQARTAEYERTMQVKVDHNNVICDEECIDRIFQENNTTITKDIGATDNCNSDLADNESTNSSTYKFEKKYLDELELKIFAEEQLSIALKERDLAEINRKKYEDELQSEHRLRKHAEDQLDIALKERDLAEIDRKVAEGQLKSVSGFRENAEELLRDAVEKNEKMVSHIERIEDELREMLKAIYCLAQYVPHDELKKIHFNEALYLENNKDVKDALAQGNVKSGFLHWLTYGYFEKRSVSFVRNPE